MTNQKRIATSLGINIDEWTEEKRRIERFYKKFFNHIVDWSKISLPIKKEGMNRLEIIFHDITEDDAFNAYAKQFGKDSVWKYCDSINKIICEQQERPLGNYAICHMGGDEPDMLDKSYDDGISGNIKFMIPKEGIISAFRYRFETGKMYDIEGATRFAALDSDGFALGMRCYAHGRFYMSYDDRGHRCSYFGLRQISF